MGDTLDGTVNKHSGRLLNLIFVIGYCSQVLMAQYLILDLVPLLKSTTTRAQVDIIKFVRIADALINSIEENSDADR